MTGSGDDAPADVTTYLYVDPTGPGAQAETVGALTTTVNSIINQRLSGNNPDSDSDDSRSTLSPGLLAWGDAPLIWGELFAAARRRGRDGFALAHGHDYRGGGLFGVEQGYGEHRLGLGWGRKGVNLFIGIDGRHALSLLLDVEYSHDASGVSERASGGFVRLEYDY